MHGLMMDTPLLISSILEHAAAAFGKQEVVGRPVEGGTTRRSYAELRDRAAQLANALSRLGVKQGDRVATLAWNSVRHLEVYYAASSMGAVCHVMNPRYSPEQIGYIVNHAEDRVLMVETSFLPLVAALRNHMPKLETVIVMTDSGAQPETEFEALNYEDLVTAEKPDFEWPRDLDERSAAGLCYTSGTTGHPKGVLYSHRSTVLHAMMAALPSNFGASERQTLMPVVPMFHVMAWGIPYAALIGGAKLVMPGPHLDGASLFDLMEAEGVALAAGVPTIWLGLAEEMRKRGRAPRGFTKTLVGGSAPSTALIDAYEREFGIRFVQGWGMTEMSPVGSVNTLPPHMDGLDPKARVAMQAKQGRQVFGVELEILDDADRPLPHDGRARGRLAARGPWIASGYYRSEASPVTGNGWLDTGDIATIDADGMVTIVDRAKDLVKSGGEWISSIDLEDHAMSVPGVALAAAIGVPHPRWDERPVVIIQPTAENPATPEQVLEHYRRTLPKWMVPEDVVVMESLPLGATGKVLKARLREAYRDHLSGKG
ncbi:MAG: long-chain fatty acid--CoA ligase [Pseudomonadota bacterium]